MLLLVLIMLFMLNSGIDKIWEFDHDKFVQAESSK
jgi:hypothetical protein